MYKTKIIGHGTKMTFSTEWNECYKNQTHLSTWPWSDMISYVKRYSSPDKPNYRVLELGCGAGANIPFFLDLGVQYYAIEGSSYMVNKIKEKFIQIKDNIYNGDFTNDIPFDVDFDLIVDRAAITHNTTKGIIRSVDLIYQKLKNGGRYIGIDWFSTTHSEYLRGREDEDNFTRTGYQDGQFANVGRVHFSDRPHMKEIFRRFEIIFLQHKLMKTEIPDEDFIFASWNIVSKKLQ